MSWETAFQQALVADCVPDMLAALLPFQTAHAGTAPASVKSKAVKLIRRACAQNPRRELALGLALAACPSETGQELGALLVGAHYADDPERVTAALLALADSPNWEVREWAAQGCGQALAEHFAPVHAVLLTWARHASANVRRAVALAAMYAADPAQPQRAAALLDLLEPLLADTDPYVKKNLGPFALGAGLLRVHPEPTLARLGQWAMWADPTVRWNVAMAFTAAAAAPHAAVAARIVGPLRLDPDAAVRRAAAKACQNLITRASGVLLAADGHASPDAD